MTQREQTLEAASANDNRNGVSICMDQIKIDLAFPLQGHEIPVDHGYPLFSALSRSLDEPNNPWLHESEDVGVHLIRGRYLGQGRLTLVPGSRLSLRIPAQFIPKLLPLAGRLIHLGSDAIRIGIPQPRALIPAPNLYAHLVTTRNGEDEARFDAEIARQLETLGIRGKFQRGPRRTFSIKEKRVVAHTVLVTELTAEESIRVQERGLGGRRKMGCGMFAPWTR